MLRLQSKKSSFHSVLYDKIPENHILKQITTVIDFSFINDLLKDNYSERYGRPAKEPELMCKLLFLQHLYNYSDEQMKAEAELNLALCTFSVSIQKILCQTKVSCSSSERSDLEKIRLMK